MSMLRTIRRVGLAVAAGALVSLAGLWLTAAPARASAGAGVCIPLLPQTCTTTTKPTTTTTKAPATTTPPTTAKATHSTTTTTAPRATTTVVRRTPGVASVGAGGPPAPSSAGDPSALGTGVDPAAPQLAVTAPPTTTAVRIAPPVALPAVAGGAPGSRNDHASARLALSLLVVVVALVAVAQFPVSRRSPRPSPEKLD
jgi:hypothetical protein